MAKIKPLKQSALFSGLTDREIAAFSQIVDEIKLKADTNLGALAKGLVLVKKGALHVSYRLDPNADPQTIELKSGESFGELSVLSGHATDPQCLNVEMRTRGECEILLVAPGKFAQLLEDHPQVFFRVVQLIGRHLQGRLLRHHEFLKRYVRDFSLAGGRESQ